MRSGSLRHRVTVQRVSESQTATGEMTKTWSDLQAVFASFEYLPSRELIASGQQVRGVEIARVMIRFMSITTKDRIVFEGKNFDIIAINNVDGRNRELELTVERGLTEV